MLLGFLPGWVSAIFDSPNHPPTIVPRFVDLLPTLAKMLKSMFIQLRIVLRGHLITYMLTLSREVVSIILPRKPWNWIHSDSKSLRTRTYNKRSYISPCFHPFMLEIIKIEITNHKGRNENKTTNVYALNVSLMFCGGERTLAGPWLSPSWYIQKHRDEVSRGREATTWTFPIYEPLDLEAWDHRGRAWRGRCHLFNTQCAGFKNLASIQHSFFTITSLKTSR